MNILNVAVGVIFDANQHVLITKRPYHVPNGGKWEFPGGKIEAHESPREALKREIQEEVGLFITKEQLQDRIEYDYLNKCVRLFVFHVIQFHGSAERLAAQLDLRWVNLTELHQYSFPEANSQIIARLQLTNS